MSDGSALVAACRVGDRPTEVCALFGVLDDELVIREHVVSDVLRNDREELEGTGDDVHGTKIEK